MSFDLFTAQELVEFYQKVEDGYIIEYKSGRLSNSPLWQTEPNGPNLKCRKDNWRIKSTKKVIDLSVLIESEVLCVFFDQSTPSSATGKLKNIRGSAAYVSNNRDSSGMPVSSRACKPLMNHKHAWQGGECPLPEGFKVQVCMRSNSVIGDMCSHFNWKWSYKAAGSDIIQFEVLGLADGYVMPWEQDDAK
tara:strand:+ start:108 stop:680 length:573 start_codon:yes stop_codon:yes gene_type:complete